MSTLLPEADFFFTSTGTPSTTWMVSRFHLREALSAVYEGVIELVEEGVSDLAAILGRPAQFVVQRSGLTRRYAGIVNEVEHLGTTMSRRRVRVRLVPQLWLLSQRTDSRIFQGLDVFEIVKEVLHDAGVYAGDDDIDRSALPPDAYAKRECCIQHEETDLNFMLRLLEDEGITFFFRTGDAGEVLVFAEDGVPDAFPTPVPTLDGRPVKVMGEGGATYPAETVRQLDYALRLQPTGVVLRDWDFTRPFDAQAASPGREAAMTRALPGAPGARSVYSYPAGAVLHHYDEGAHFYHGDDLAHRARVRATELSGRSETGRGRGVVTGFAPGRKVSLLNEEGALLGDFTLTEVEHAGSVPDGEHDPHPPVDLDRYGNRFTYIPLGAVFRPARVTPRPYLGGLQTALVMARAGSTEEIDVDHHGRVLVRFHWERADLRVASQRARDASCRVRVSQSWAGDGWGVVFNPRVGMEVVVQFVDGNPDRPLITGCVSNLHHPPPPRDDLVAKRTRSTIRTSSSPGGHGFNELSFEDHAGHEQVFLHAQKDLDEVVLHNHTERVRCNETISVGGDQSVSVGGNQTVHVRGVQTVTVDGVHGSAGRHGSLKVTGDLRVESTNEIMITAPTKITLDCAGSTITLTPGKIVLADGGGATITLDGADIKIEGANVTVHGSAKVDINGSPVNIQGNALVDVKATMIKLNS